ncbi:uncharacterized protein LOC129567495 [Sitodiplosis mosellana]|uniref:uncharacterized protein LOC129567495 n=1 Tax=Sitodiplosis mosellana TaxID=263140 RepID=UPI0024449E24|nr:uncharacterized protein LOC129567495 [Sitodiplosis mosellana]
MTNIMIIYFLTTCCILKDAFSLELTKIVIPTYKFHGEAALLECQYELKSSSSSSRNYHNRFSNNKDYGHRSIHTSISDDNNGIDHLRNRDDDGNGGGAGTIDDISSDEEETLYAVKWYKDNEEFYRYVPKANPPQQSYRVDGVRVDHQSSNDVKVMIRRLNIKSSGVYRCEISAEAPNFSSVEGEGRMEVVYLPREGPHISGEQSQYQIGDTLNINCTSGKSHPSSSIQWFINDIAVYDSSVIAYPPIVHQHGLVTTVLGLHMQLDSSHFEDSLMRVKCLTSISPLIPIHSMEGNAAEARESAYSGNGNGNSNGDGNNSNRKTNHAQRKPPLTDSREVFLLVRNTAAEHRAVSKPMAFSLVMLLILFKQFLA